MSIFDSISYTIVERSIPMNYYNPYFYTSPTMTGASAPGLFRSLFKGAGSGINWSSLLSNTQKTIGIINQAIPMVKQVSPMMQNAKTMFKVMNEFKKVEPTQAKAAPSTKRETGRPMNTQTPSSQPVESTPAENSISVEEGPQFFI